MQRCPALFAVTAVLRHYLSEEDTYGLVAQLVSSKSPRFVAEGAQRLEVEWRTAMQLNKKYNVSCNNSFCLAWLY